MENDRTQKSLKREVLIKDMALLVQFAEEVVNYSSTYNGRGFGDFNFADLCRGPVNDPGINPYTFMLRSYGKWWNESEEARSHYKSREDADSIISEDFVTVRFEEKVIPESVTIYEMCNTGAVVRIWARSMQHGWILLWEGAPQKCESTCREFCPPIRKVLELVDELRIELNQSLLQYHAVLEAIHMSGYKPKTALQLQLIEENICRPERRKRKKETVKLCEEAIDCNLFSKLSNETVLHILKYLDLRSLCRFSQVNKRMYQISSDPSLYQEISLHKYWHKVNNDTLNYLMTRSKNNRKLDLSWCINKEEKFKKLVTRFMQHCCQNLTHLSLNYCNFVQTGTLKEISSLSNLTDLQLRGCKFKKWNCAILMNFKKLTSLDLCDTNIIDDALVDILKTNPDLKHLNIDFCFQLTNLNMIAKAASTYNPKLITWSSWNVDSFYPDFINYFANCKNLRELDLGWSLYSSDPQDYLERLANGCKDLRRLIISGWRSTQDHQLLPLLSCKELTELNLFALQFIKADICDRLLASLPKLRLLDISFCRSIKEDQVEVWREQYPNVVIQYVCNNFVM